MIERHMLAAGGNTSRFVYEYGSYLLQAWDDVEMTPTEGSVRNPNEPMSIIAFAAGRDNNAHTLLAFTFSGVTAGYIQDSLDGSDGEWVGTAIGLEDVSDTPTGIIYSDWGDSTEGVGMSYVRIIGAEPTVVDVANVTDWSSGYTYEHAVEEGDIVFLHTVIREGASSATNLTEVVSYTIPDGASAGVNLFVAEIESDGTFSTVVTRTGSQQYVLQVIILRAL